MNKKINLDNLTQEQEQRFLPNIVEIDGYIIEIDNAFRMDKIRRYIGDLIKGTDIIIKNGDKSDIYNYMLILLIRNFTDINFKSFNEEKDEVLYNLNMLSVLIDEGLFEKIINSFNQDEVAKLFEYVKRAGDNIEILANNPDMINVLNVGIEKSEDNAI